MCEKFEVFVPPVFSPLSPQKPISSVNSNLKQIVWPKLVCGVSLIQLEDVVKSYHAPSGRLREVSNNGEFPCTSPKNGLAH